MFSDASYTSAISNKFLRYSKNSANVSTRKFAQRFSTDECKQFIDVAMQPINPVMMTARLSRRV